TAVAAGRMFTSGKREKSAHDLLEAGAAVEHERPQAALVSSAGKICLPQMKDLAFELLLDLQSKVVLVEHESVERIRVAPQKLARPHKREDLEREDVARRRQILVVEEK